MPSAENDARRERVLRAASVPPESGDEDFDALATRQLLAAMDHIIPPEENQAGRAPGKSGGGKDEGAM